ncbi:MAG: nucleotide exchange factor GrpE [Anaerolineaceae bacterium]|nr:MAG: nucleotide exchange factor GrpE [Anaerolineaceae bacterium]
MDKTIEVIKAAMEKEEKAKLSEESMEKKIDEHTADEKTEGCQTKDRKDNEMLKKEEDLMETDIVDKNQPSQEEEVLSKSSKSFLKSAKNKELAAKEEKILELNDRLMRSMAEFDNFRKRSEKEKSQMYDLGVKNIIEKILPVIDNFERGLDSVNEADRDSPLVQGFNMIYKQLMTTMDEIGVKVIEAVGNEFDPNFHNAVLHGEDEEFGENIVSEEYQKGYMYRDTVVRHSMVKVVN